MIGVCDEQTRVGRVQDGSSALIANIDGGGDCSTYHQQFPTELGGRGRSRSDHPFELNLD